MLLNSISLVILFIACSARDAPNSRQSNAQQDLQPLPTSYQFSYSTGNEAETAQMFREEKRSADGTVTGKYGYVDPNGHLRVVNYRAGANGFSASGDVGPDRESMKLAAQFQAEDEATRIQNEVWQKMRSGLNWGNWGAPSWAQPQSPVTFDWNSLMPNWNSAPPSAPAPVNPSWSSAPPPPPPAPESPSAAPPAPAAQPQPPPVSIERQWDDRVRNNQNSYQPLSDNRADIDIPNLSNPNWNTYNSRQNNWNSNAGSSGGSDKILWETRINHDSRAQNPAPVGFASASRSSSPSSSGPSPAAIQKEWPAAHNPETNPLTNGAYVYFNVDHKGSDKTAPYNFGYSY